MSNDLNRILVGLPDRLEKAMEKIREFEKREQEIREALVGRDWVEDSAVLDEIYKVIYPERESYGNQ